jgi:hypothetical protein
VPEVGREESAEHDMIRNSQNSLKTMKTKEYEITTINKNRDGSKVVKVERHPEDAQSGQPPNR